MFSTYLNFVIASLELKDKVTYSSSASVSIVPSDLSVENPSTDNQKGSFSTWKFPSPASTVLSLIFSENFTWILLRYPVEESLISLASTIVGGVVSGKTLFSSYNLSAL
ncbi:hypothetical protein [Cytobacillus gottheilii]|uniref:Uncharacterized protein n=1 Tax=Cytobacillus gottheilii TaxID=859144 RepID=A0ABX8FAC5_9BACI|nr:hypothetical protein [Cytobacillus gottheilii]QVY61310.1 hypothetical protein J1899_20575 [Cytobacillus gottheilii]